MTLQVLSSAMLVCDDLSSAAGAVHFDFNPSTLEMSRQGVASTPHTASPNSPGSTSAAGKGTSPAHGAAPAVSTGASLLTIRLNNLVFYGLTTQMNCEKLLSWVQLRTKLITTPVPGSMPPTLLFIWGPPIGGFNQEVNMTAATVRYTRFLPEGTPIRAEVNLTLTEQPTRLRPTNPSSGGLPGRRSHTLIAGENLQALAVANYGTAGAWRRIAEANDIDDPLRVAAGRRVYLPGGGELRSRSDK